MAEGEAVGANESIVVRSEEQGDIDADVESLVLVEHAHCTADNCWRQKYMESLSQLRSVLVELRSELEEKSVLEEATRSQETRHQTKVQLIEEVMFSTI